MTDDNIPITEPIEIAILPYVVLLNAHDKIDIEIATVKISLLIVVNIVTVFNILLISILDICCIINVTDANNITNVPIDDIIFPYDVFLKTMSIIAVANEILISNLPIESIIFVALFAPCTSIVKSFFIIFVIDKNIILITPTAASIFPYDDKFIDNNINDMDIAIDIINDFITFNNEVILLASFSEIIDILLIKL